MNLSITTPLNGRSISFDIPPIRRSQSEGPCNVSLHLDVNGITQVYLLGTFNAADTSGWASLRNAFDRSYAIVSIVLCGILGWGNTADSNVVVRAVALILSLLLIVPNTGVALTRNSYNITYFGELKDPVHGISVNQVAFVIVYMMLVVLTVMHFVNLILSLPISSLQHSTQQLFFHRKRESNQISYVKAMFKDFRWASPSQRFPTHSRPDTHHFSYMQEARLLIAGTRSNKDAFYFPLRLQASLLLSTVAMIPIFLGCLHFVWETRTLIFQTIMPFFKSLFAAIDLFDSQITANLGRPQLSQNSSSVVFAFSTFEKIFGWADTIVFAIQTSLYVGLSLGLLRFILGQFSLLLTARSNLLAARKAAFKIDSTISDYDAFFFIGNQIACSILGFLTFGFVGIVVVLIVIPLTIEKFRMAAIAFILEKLPVLVFAILAIIMKCVVALSRCA